MKRRLPRVYNRKMIRAIKEFDLINPGDRILIGFSGGKDSALLLYGLAILREHGIIHADLEALTRLVLPIIRTFTVLCDD